MTRNAELKRMLLADDNPSDVELTLEALGVDRHAIMTPLCG